MKKFNVTVNGNLYEVEVEEVGKGSSYAPAATPVAAAPVVPVASAPASAPAAAPPAAPAPAAPKAAKPKAGKAGSVQVTAPMPGNIWKILVKEGQSVKKGDNMLILEAMKMENEILAPQDGVIAQIAVKEGSTVNTGDLMITLG